MKLPFYSQCYATAPLALAFSLAATLAQTVLPWASGAAVAIVVATAIWYLALQANWFRKMLHVGWSRAVADAAIGYAEALVLLFLVSLLFA